LRDGEGRNSKHKVLVNEIQNMAIHKHFEAMYVYMAMSIW